jgi:hypothetical protein
VAVLGHLLDLLRLFGGERGTDPAQLLHAAGRIVQRLAERERGVGRVTAERLRQVERRLGRALEDVVPFAGDVADLGEPQQHRLGTLDDLVVDPRLPQLRLRELVDRLRRLTRHRAGRAERGPHLGVDDDLVLQLVGGAPDGGREPVAAEEAGRRERDRPAETTEDTGAGERAPVQLPEVGLEASQRTGRTACRLLADTADRARGRLPAVTDRSRARRTRRRRGRSSS